MEQGSVTKNVNYRTFDNFGSEKWCVHFLKGKGSENVYFVHAKMLTFLDGPLANRMSSIYEEGYDGDCVAKY